MTDLVHALLLRELSAFVREIELLPDDETLWKTTQGVTNSCGNLALHVAGNLQHYVGHLLGGSDYARDRTNEFGARSGTRAEVAAELQRAADAVDRALRSLAPEALDRPFPETVGGMTPVTRVFLLHLVSHTAFHLGQAGYLRRMLTGDGQTSGAIAIKDIRS